MYIYLFFLQLFIKVRDVQKFFLVFWKNKRNRIEQYVFEFIIVFDSCCGKNLGELKWVFQIYMFWYGKSFKNILRRV